MAISLSAGVRQSLQSLQSTAMSAQTAQGRLSSGKRVNSAIDNPVNFFTAQSLNNRADDLRGLLDGMSNTVQTIKSASTGIDGMTKLVKAMQATVKQAQSDAATVKPAVAGTVAGATAAEATATGKSLQEVTLGKAIVDDNAATANDATASYAGNMGLAATNTNLAVSITAGKQTFTADLKAGATVRDLVDTINASGIATAAVGTDGKLTVTGAGSGDVKVGVGASTTAALAQTNSLSATPAGNATFGLATTAVTAKGSSAVRSALVKQFNDTRTQLDQLAKDSGYNGTNLLAGDTLKTVFNEKTGTQQSRQVITGQKVSADSLNIGEAGSATLDFQKDTDLNDLDAALTSSLTSLNSLASSLGASLSVVQSRQDFSNGLIDTLRSGADNLVNADTNEEGANLLALQTRQSLAQTALSLSAQADQAVLKLF